VSSFDSRSSHQFPIVTALLAAAILLAPAFAQSAPAPAVPDNLKPPADQHLLLHGHATGDQIYTCQPVPGSSSQFAWVLSGPDAKIADDNGKEIAKHFAGPTWESTDGSQVKGKVVNQAAPEPSSIAWLLLTAVDHSGSGVMSEVRWVQRLNTQGGKAPAGGCDAGHQGEKVHVGYSADYYFYGQ
jgi:FtsP/CotA-like multicopper oxidase with cupredoxin domain